MTTNKYCNTIPNCSKMHFVFIRDFIGRKKGTKEEERKRNREGGGGIDSCIRRERSALIYVVCPKDMPLTLCHLGVA